MSLPDVAVTFLFGVTLGSFLNVVIDRVPRGQSLLRPPSHCPACGYSLRPLDLIPVVSYLALRGRCRRCHSAIPLRSLLVELAAGAIPAAFVAAYGLNFTAIFYSLAALSLGALALIDLEHGIVPNALLLVLTPAALLASFFQPVAGTVSHIIGAAVAFSVLLGIALLRRTGIGWGDVKLAPFLGLLTAFPYVIAALLISFIVGGTFGALLLLSRRASAKTAVPFVPFLALGTFLAMVWGKPLLNWYFSFF